ncbi:DUF881 domain-containing protein [Geodermatophilus marinus]|uniref:DUF881 domain-containing protein n=1 Tax=Geodermatophilus sp. LHW52908 TaxID=2303986 RepID=UPI000E3C2FB2|nr:DUF881 domain-containing protein [Geodermatophilus sp. LHW52908]RFU20721.1 DUF881 domain-containing protein [Geodermatophilus sp. LHW52908]
MSTAPRGGGPRSMGASLLDQVLAETLDPAYEQAARARAERAAAGVPEPPRRRRAGQVAVALTLAFAGLLAGVTYNEAAAGEPARAEIRAALVDDIMAATETTDRLAADLEQLRADVAAARAEALAASAVGQRALDALEAAEVAAAATAVEGPGLLVTLADAEPDADSDPVGGGGVDPRGQVRDGDLQLVVNALWAAGAEAVAINGQRLGPTTAIRFAGEAVLVDFRPVTNPYLVSAIGDPATLRSDFLASPEVASLAVISQSFGLRFEFAQEDELTLPAGSPPELRSATPLAEEPAGGGG